MSYRRDYWSRELQAGRCPAAGDSAHAWEKAEPPEYEDTSQWGNQEWADWYEFAPSHCWRCGEHDDD